MLSAERINELCYINVLEHYTTIKVNKSLHVIIWVNLINITWNEFKCTRINDDDSINIKI